jgi:uncharacterized NAD(P)/FAD-binding protein YdhS
MEYVSLKELLSTDQINDDDRFLVSIFDNSLNTFHSRGMKWRDIKDRFADQIKNMPDAWFTIPNLSSQ